MSLISIITVDYNQPETTLSLLKSIDFFYPVANIEIIVVDNGSIVDNGDKFKAENPRVKFIRSAENLGFAGGNNLGIEAASGAYLFLVNNDTEFTAGLLETLSETLALNPEVGIISPKIKYFDQPEILQYVGYTEMNYYTCRNHCVGQYELDTGQYDRQVGQTGYVHGAAMMIRKEALVAAGTMADNFFLYFEEMDWCERIRDAGFQIWVNPQATIYHKESISVGKNSALKAFFMNRNRILFIRRNASWLQRSIFYLYFGCIVAPRNMISYARTGNASFIPVLLSAIKWNLTQPITSAVLGYTHN
jgi:GT2 family glycosyltransferase